MIPRTCVSPEGFFIFSIHKPAFKSENLREKDYLTVLGKQHNGAEIQNQANFPSGNIIENNADWIYEIPNPFPFRGTTYIGKTWADGNAKAPRGIELPQPKPASLTAILINYLELNDNQAKSTSKIDDFFANMPRPLCLALAVTSTDPEDLVRLARICCKFSDKSDGFPEGLLFSEGEDGRVRPIIIDEKLFEAVANNPHLPDPYKKVMVLNPGVQGTSEIVGEWTSKTKKSHVFEYLRRNSYIPWGHYAANMAHDAVRYRAEDLLPEDIYGMRHLYYQRTYVRLAEQLGIELPFKKQSGSDQGLEQLREEILSTLKSSDKSNGLTFDRTLWGWNFGFDYAASGYRLHASHQQVHQQYAMVPSMTSSSGSGDGDELIESYACGDLIANFVEDYRKTYGVSFFDSYEKAIRSNRRMDQRQKNPRELIVHEDENIILFVPKAQTSQWELQLMPKKETGNIIDANLQMRASLDHAIWIAMRTLGVMGAKMITVFEFSSKITPKPNDQRLLYTFLPRLPESPGAFSEAQLRWINGHYPEDFAAACRSNLPESG